MKQLLVLAIISAVFLSGCVSQTSEIKSTEKKGEVIEKDTGAMQKQGEVMQKEGNMTEKSGEVMKKETSYTGKLIAGTTTKYLRFNQVDHEKALAEGKVIYFYFYANWCPICAEERPKVLQAFNEMNYPNVIGFEVHFNDNEVTKDDESIARKFGISYQHTTVIHVVGTDKTGKEAFRSLSPISKETIKEKIASLV